MQNDNEALLSISLAGQGQLVKMFITIEPHYIFSLNYESGFRTEAVFG